MNVPTSVAKFVAGLALVGLAACTPAVPVTSTFSNATPITIPASGTPAGIANPYPSSIVVTGLTGDLTNVTVTLHAFSHTWPADVSVLLMGPNGQAVELVGRAGGSFPVENVTFTLDDDAATSLPAPIVAGTFQPTVVF